MCIRDSINISFHIRAIDQSEAIKMVKRKNTDIDKMKIEENKKAVRSGYDMDILPSDLITYGEDVKDVYKRQQQGSMNPMEFNFILKMREKVGMF